MRRALESVNERILASIKQRHATTQDLFGSNNNSTTPRLVAVSKLKPPASIIEAYDCGQRHFGENYIQELYDKSNCKEITERCPDIKFHFIGHLQSNKVNKLLKVKNLFMIETIDSVKLANIINGAIDRRKVGPNKDGASSSNEDETGSQSLSFLGSRLKVMIQVNTSGEGQKSGIDPSLAPQLAEHILKDCRWLELAGVMTIGKLDGWTEEGPNKDFLTLRQVRQTICEKLSIEPSKLELSMGMSGDFEEAIALGSTSVRVGTLIFGQRG